MIRELRKADINQVADIWLDTNIKAHYFIPAQYWKSNLELVKELLLQATVYVYEDNQKIQGFIGLNGEYIEGIFVSEAMQSQSIGKILLNYVKNTRSKLILNVYQNNTPAISFYQREGFEIQYSGLDEATGEKDYRMAWQQKQKYSFSNSYRNTKPRQRRGFAMPEKKEWKALHSPLSNFHSKLAALQQTGRLGGINQVGHTAQADAQR